MFLPLEFHRNPYLPRLKFEAVVFPQHQPMFRIIPSIRRKINTSITPVPSRFLRVPFNAKKSPTLPTPAATWQFPKSSCAMILKSPAIKLTSMYFASKASKSKPDDAETIIHANDGMWHEPKQTIHRAQVIRSYLETESMYKKHEYNDYMAELQATRDIAVDEWKEKQLELDSEQDSDDDDSMFVDTRSWRARDRALANATTKEQKEAAHEKYDEKVFDTMGSRMIMLVAMWFVFMSVNYDLQNPDTML